MEVVAIVKLKMLHDNYTYICTFPLEIIVWGTCERQNEWFKSLEL